MAHELLRSALRKKQGGCCCYCGKKMVRHKANGGTPPDDMETLEHLIRHADGGKTVPDNVALSCHPCNFGRGTMDWFTYASYRRGELFA